jgi:hypothetical protein
MFFGREDIFEFIKQRLAGGPQDNIIILHGQRRTGKTSILYQMHRRVDPRYLCVFVDLQALDLNGLDKFLRELAYRVASSLQRDYGVRVPAIDEEQLAEHPRTYFRDRFLDSVWSAIGDHRLLLMLDEVARIQEQVQAGNLGRDVFEYLRHLMQHYGQLNFLFSLISGFEEPEREYANLLGVGLYKPVSFLSRTAAEALVTQPVEGVYTVEPAALDHVLRLTSCHPYYTQLVCQCLFANCQHNGLTSVQTQVIEAVVDEAVELGQPNIKFVWEEATPGEKAVLAALAASMRGPLEPTSLGKVFDTWARRGVLLPEEEIGRAVRSLRYRQIISSGASYGFTVDLQRRWLSQERGLELVEQEIGSWIALWGRRPSAQGQMTDSAGRQALPEGHVTGALKPLRFGGRPYSDRRELARALATEWETATRRYFAAMGTPSGPSEAWQTLRDWLRQFDDPVRHDTEGRIDLIDNYLSGEATPDVKLLYLLRWLDPTMPPVYRGRRLLPEDLVVVGLQAHQADDSAESLTSIPVVTDLWNGKLLRLLAGFSGGEELVDIDRRWRGYVQRWLSGQGWQGRVPVQVAESLAEASIRGLLLSLAAAPEQQLTVLRSWATRAVATVRGPVPWFQRLVQTAGDDPLQHVAVILSSPHAVADVERVEQKRRDWERAEMDRLGRRAEAVRWVRLGGIPLLAFWGLLPLLAISNQSLSFLNQAAVTILALAGLTTQVVAEFYVAVELRGDYHPRWSFLGWLARMGKAIGQGTVSWLSSVISGWLPDDTSDDTVGNWTLLALCILILLIGSVALIFLLLIFGWLVGSWWVMVLAVVGIVHAASAYYRIRIWRSDHAKRCSSVFGQV